MEGTDGFWDRMDLVYWHCGRRGRALRYEGRESVDIIRNSRFKSMLKIAYSFKIRILEEVS
jgi:hypothetical protein